MSDKISEILELLQEECAEVIVTVSKARRFGMNSDNFGQCEYDNRTHLMKECGDVLALVELLVEHKLIGQEELAQAIEAKKTKLRKYSKIYE